MYCAHSPDESDAAPCLQELIGVGARLRLRRCLSAFFSRFSSFSFSLFSFLSFFLCSRLMLTTTEPRGGTGFRLGFGVGFGLGSGVGFGLGFGMG